MFRRNRNATVETPVVAPIHPVHFHELPGVRLNHANAQIVNVDVERVKRHVVTCNGIPQKNERDADLVVRFSLRVVDGDRVRQFDLASTCGADARPWKNSGVDGLIEHLFDFFSVASLSKLKGRFVRVLLDADDIWAIGDYAEDRWFTRVGDRAINSREPDGMFRIAGSWKQCIPNTWGHIMLLEQVYSAAYENAKIKVATLVPAGAAMELHLRLSIGTGTMRNNAPSQDVVVTYRPRTMEELTALTEKLCELTGLQSGQFTKLPGRLVRIETDPYPDVSFSGADREHARHFYVKHPLQNISLDMATYNGTRENVPSAS